MNIQSFLQIWNKHNDTIIEVLVALVLFLVIYLAFRYFFGPQSSEGGISSAIDTKEIEKTLSKILEAQSKVPAPIHITSEAGAAAPIVDAAGQASALVELEKLKKELADKEKLLAAAQEEAAKKPTAGAPSAPSAASKELEIKVKDLEARLAEYEIISEDIADLSFYKEENVRLQKELTSAKSAPAPAPEMSAVASAPAAPAEAAPIPEPVAPAPVAAAEIPADPVVAAPAATEAVAEPAPAPIADEDIMKEFAKAVQEQKSTPAPPPPQTDAKENTELMNQFENFVKKS